MPVPNYFMVVEVRPEEWKRKLIIPVPLFLVDEVLKAWPLIRPIIRKYMPQDWNSQLEGAPINLATIKHLDKDILKLWRTIRRAGRCTLVEVEDGDTHVRIRLI